MSDSTIRAGARAMLSTPVVVLGGIFTSSKLRSLIQVMTDALPYAKHKEGVCRHCYPDTSPLVEGATVPFGASLSEDNVVISRTCNTDLSSTIHSWCANRDWTETHCGCKCHCIFEQKKREAEQKARRKAYR